MIELCNGYYIEVDPMNFTLKKRGRGKNKKGEEVDTEKVIGHFSTLEGAIERFVKLSQIDYLPHTGIKFDEYIEMVVTANRMAVQAVKTALEV